MASAEDAARFLLDKAHGIAKKVDDEPTGVVPGYRAGLGGTVLPNGKIRYASDTPGGSSGGAQVYMASGGGAQTVTSGASAADISWTGARYDSGGYWSAGSPAILTVPADGLYLMTLRIAWSSNSGGYRFANLRQANAAGYDNTIGSDTRNATNGDVTVQTFSVMALLNAGDEIRATVFQNSGSTRTILGGSGSTGTTPDAFDYNSTLIIRPL